jgi:hypothetical protein
MDDQETDFEKRLAKNPLIEFVIYQILTQAFIFLALLISSFSLPFSDLTHSWIVLTLGTIIFYLPGKWVAAWIERKFS